MVNGCKTTKGLDTYEFEQNIPYSKLAGLVSSLKDEAGTSKYIKTKNVLNYNGKIVGILVRLNNDESGVEETKGEQQEIQLEEFMVPCRPSPLMYYDDDYELQTSESVWLHDVEPRSYNATRNFLETLAMESNGEIKSKPMIKIAKRTRSNNYWTPYGNRSICSGCSYDVRIARRRRT